MSRALSETGEILRRHVNERRIRSSVRSMVLDGDPLPRMTDAQFVDSCQLVQGVPEWTLQLLETWWCESAGPAWTVNAVQIGNQMVNVPIEQVATRLTLVQAAERLGVSATYRQLDALYREAMSLVLDNVIKRARRTMQENQ